MKLLIDLGNTRLKWATLENGQLSAQSAVVHQNNFSAIAEQYLAKISIPGYIYVASGLEAKFEKELSGWVNAHWQCPIEFIRTSKQAMGVSNAYIKPEDLGVDRWLNLIACHHLIAGAACVVDCGTAITVDTIEASGKHLGGCIMPGLDLMRSSLNRAGQVNIESYSGVDLNCFSHSTQSAIASGTCYAAVKAVDGMLAQIKNCLDEDITCVITGGDALLIRPLLAVETQYDVDWCMKGMMILVSDK